MWWSVRTATPADAGALRELHRHSSLIWEEDRAALDAHPELFGVDPAALADGRTRAALGDDGAIVGFATVTAACELEDLFVAPEQMRRGIGTGLVADAVARAGPRCCLRARSGVRDRDRGASGPHVMQTFRSAQALLCT